MSNIGFLTVVVYNSGAQNKFERKITAIEIALLKTIVRNYGKWKAISMEEYYNGRCCK